MKKLAYAFAALATIAIATPTIASAEEFGVRVGSDRDMYRDRAFRGAHESPNRAQLVPRHSDYDSLDVTG